MARVERWSVRTLRQKIQGMLYERTAISRKPDELARILQLNSKLATHPIDPSLDEFLRITDLC
jgi:predicted nuclease of restriction endonuclease-like (RecB) superfamily